MRTARHIGVAILAAMVLVAAIAVLLATARREEQRLQQTLQAKLAAIKAADQPISAQDLGRLYPDPPPSQDASLLLGRSLALTVRASPKVPYLGGRLPARTVPMEGETRKAVDAFLESNRAALEALPNPVPDQIWFPIGFTNGFTNLAKIPLVEIRHLVQLLCVNAIAQADDGEAPGTTRSLQQSFQIGRALRSDLLINHMVRRAVESLSCMALERSVNQTRFSDTELAVLVNTLTNAQPDGFKAALIAERCMGIWGLDMMRTGLQSQRWDERLPMLFSRLRGRRVYRNDDFLLFLERCDGYLSAADLPPRDRLKRMAEIDGSIQATKPSAMLALLGSRWEKAARSDAEIQTRLLVARVGLAVECYRIAHADGLPRSLTDLLPDYLPDVPLDPFDSMPLRYKRRARGLLVYSIGPDGTDNDGAEKPDNKPDATGYDISFTLER